MEDKIYFEMKKTLQGKYGLLVKCEIYTSDVINEEGFKVKELLRKGIIKRFEFKK